MLVGHQKQIEIFQRIIDNNALSHAYLFSGPRGVGKNHFAQTLAHWLQHKEDANFEDFVQDRYSCTQVHPDIIELHGDVSIGGVRDLRHTVSLSSYPASHKVVIINNIEILRRESANALLATLEEPKGKIVFMLISDMASLVVPTILSRCYQIKFHYAADDIIAKNFNVEAIGDLKAHWGGRTAIVRELLDNPDIQEKYRGYRQDWSFFVAGDYATRFKIIEKYAKYSKADALDLLRIWMEFTAYKQSPLSVDKYSISGHLLNIYKSLYTTNINFQYILNSLAVNMK